MKISCDHKIMKKIILSKVFFSFQLNKTNHFNIKTSYLSNTLYFGGKTLPNTEGSKFEVSLVKGQ